MICVPLCDHSANGDLSAIVLNWTVEIPLHEALVLVQTSLFSGCETLGSELDNEINWCKGRQRIFCHGIIFFFCPFSQVLGSLRIVLKIKDASFFFILCLPFYWARSAEQKQEITVTYNEMGLVFVPIPDCLPLSLLSLSSSWTAPDPLIPSQKYHPHVKGQTVPLKHGCPWRWQMLFFQLRQQFR